MIDPYEYHIADEMKRTRTPDKTLTAEENIMNNVQLLPLPEWRGDFMTESEFREEAEAYARACVSSATEALRAEVAAAIGEAMQSRADAKEWQGAAEIYRDRAERLAEALREAREYVVSELAAERSAFAGYERWSNIASIEADLAKIDAALEQERS